ncbi:MAG: AAA family ATPase, partial [Candidatus Cloacimonetes bacterium]|nr:AAA family ATPase [Candidatus Cloacimonadota bacterium]
MPHLEGIRVRNYRALHDITIGRTFENLNDEKMTRFIAVIGPNGSGKSTLMDVFGFIRDCLRFGVEEACDQPHRRGFERLKTRRQPGPIQFELYYREEKTSRPISYSLSIDQNVEGRTVVTHERLRQRRKGQKRGHPFTFLEIENGSGYAWAGEATEEEEGSERVAVR